MSECRKAFEARFKCSEWTQENWLIWRLAWNAALRANTNYSIFLIEGV